VATAKQKPNGQQALPLKPERTKKLDVSALENWLWEAACTIRGPLDAPKFKDYILPLIFLKRLSDVFEDEVAHLAHDFGDVKKAAKLVEQDHKLVRFYIPQKARWSFIVEKSTGLGELPGRFPSALATIGASGYGHPWSLMLRDALRIRVLVWKPTSP